MKSLAKQVSYQWVFESIEIESGEIEDCNYYEISEIAHHSNDISKDVQGRATHRTDVGIVRDVGNDIEGLTDRSWAYVDFSGDIPTLPEFTDGGHRIPKAVRKHFDVCVGLAFQNQSVKS